MTQTPIAPPSPDDIVLQDDDLTTRLDREADAILRAGEGAAFAPSASSLRAAVRSDAIGVRDHFVERLEGVRDGVREHPLKTVLYAAGVGLILGMLIRR